ncbi:heat shock factor protein 5-like [Ictalurus furcatus]|uniref:heat shock factor protein 5-like n=1 Tax=Ictalurus furcatus TaxID=66913 RepID=UPI0023501AD9|nr:heat shock factor protein 5-like [Ictalurus furcatus]
MEIDEATFVTLINPNQFPAKLWRLVNDPQIRSIWWDTSGEGILVHQQAFEAEVLLSQPRHLSEYFRTTDFVSFIRQLNLYGFRKERTDRDVSDKQPNVSSIKAQLHHFHNPFFKRDKPELLVKLKRLTPLNKAKLAGREVTSRKSKHFHHGMLNSPQETSGLKKTAYQRCSPDVLDSKVPCFQQPAASYSPCGYYPGHSVRYVHPIDQDPYWKAGDVPESRTSDMKDKEKVDLDTIFKLADEIQAEVEVAAGTSYLIRQLY